MKIGDFVGWADHRTPNIEHPITDKRWITVSAAANKSTTRRGGESRFKIGHLANGGSTAALYCGAHKAVCRIADC